MITCPKCGYENPDSTTNCVRCHINLQFASENIEQFKTRWQGEKEYLENLPVTPTTATRDIIEFLFRSALFASICFAWGWASNAPLSNVMNLTIIVGGVLLVFPLIWFGRRILDRHPTTSGVTWITTFVHSALGILFGVTIVRAVITYQDWSGWVLPVSSEIGSALAIISGAASLLTVVNLALKGFGAPFFILLSQKLAVDWLYAWTRNPMVLAFLAFLLSLGICFQSVLFVFWVLILVVPAFLVFLKVYEERELEIRFGASYLEYKSRTPMLFPRRPKG